MAPSIIGEDLTVTGNIISKGEVQIEGDVQGDVFCSNLIIGDRGRVTGVIVAEQRSQLRQRPAWPLPIAVSDLQRGLW